MNTSIYSKYISTLEASLAIFTVGRSKAYFQRVRFSLAALLLLVAATASTAQTAPGQSSSVYSPNDVLVEPVNYHGVQDFLMSQVFGLNGGSNKMAAPANIKSDNGALNNTTPANGIIVSPMFGAISGPDTVCANSQAVTYSVAISSVDGSPVTFYWFIPTDWTIVSGQGTNSITVIPGSQSGLVAAFAIGYCICTYSCMPVTSKDSEAPCVAPQVTLNGETEACSFEEEYTYTATLTAGTATSYSWTVPSDWIVMSDMNSASITVIPGSESGNVTVTVTNECGTDTEQIYVTAEDCGPVNPLPVELMSFDAARAQATVVLRWATASEKNNDRFEIERSLDGTRFEKIGSVRGNGTTNLRSDYNFTDNRAAKSVAYYRLKQVDTDGKFEYSPVRAVRESSMSAASISAYPNPVMDVVTLEIGDDVDESAMVRINSVTGQVVWTGTTRDLSAQQNRLNIGHLNSGVYIITFSNGQDSKSLRIVKN